MHAANLQKSSRLKRLYNLLKDGKKRSTREIMNAANICAVSTAIAELRDNSCNITCERQGMYWYYQMM